MARMNNSRRFTALKVEGGIMPPEFLHAIANLEASQQMGERYGLSKSLGIKDEVARYWRIGNDKYARYTERRSRDDLDASQVGVEEWLVSLLQELFGYGDLTTRSEAVLNERTFKLTHHAFDGSVPFLLTTRNFDLDKSDPHFGEDGQRQSPHNTMQEYLNAEDGALWGILSNGSKLRILRDNASLTRPSYIEADLDLMFEEALYPDFSAFWLTAHASRLQPEEQNKPSSCIAEAWRSKAHETGERAREKLRDGVTNALRELGNGFLQHPSNRDLAQAIQEGKLTPEGFFQQLLRLVYRLLFLFKVEESDLLHSPDAEAEQRTVYAEGYSLSRLRERARHRRHYDRNADLWQSLQISFKALAGGATGLGIQALGGLFRDEQCPDLDYSAISNKHLLEAVHNLAFFRSDHSLVNVNYRDMDTEELGSVYESLLELHPVVSVDAPPLAFSFVGDGSDQQAKGSERKLSGSYYTPSSLVNELIKSTLEPVLEQAIASSPEDPRGAILNLRILDPACGSGHFLLAAARRLAIEIARIESGNDTSDESIRQHALREVVQHCIFGVDRNLFAVELCRTALWIEAIEPGKPLTFLDPHIAHGDSLVGLLNPETMGDEIPNDAYKALTGDDKKVCLDLKKKNKSRMSDMFEQGGVRDVDAPSIDIESMPEDTLDDIELKRTAWKERQHSYKLNRERMRANLFVGAYFVPKTVDTMDTVPTSEDIARLDGGNAPQRNKVKECVSKLAEENYFLHWQQAFPDIMPNGGFDVVLGNPPWERIKLQEKEFFASRSPKVANAQNKAERARLINRLVGSDAPADQNLHQQFESAKHQAEAISHYIRTSGRYPLTGTGDLNTYAVFAETFLQLTKPSGRAGMIVPTGIATDNTTRKFFEYLISQHRLVSLFDFENREGIFSGVHRQYKFCLLTLHGESNPASKAEFAFFLRQVEQLKEVERRFTLSADDFALFNPNTRTCPIFRTERDMEIACKMYQRAGIFWREGNGDAAEHNPWGVKFSTMFHMSNDSNLFRTREALENDGWTLDGNVFVRGDERYLPLYEAKLFHQYDHRFATFEGTSSQDIKDGKANPRPMATEEKRDPVSAVIPRYWVAEEKVEETLKTSIKSNSYPPPPAKSTLDKLTKLAGNSLPEESPRRPT